MWRNGPFNAKNFMYIAEMQHSVLNYVLCKNLIRNQKAVKRSSRSISNEDWLKENNELIDAACFDEDAFEELLDVLEEESRVDLYDLILKRWDNANVFDAIHDDKVFIASFKKNTYDW
ncbi:hypothetical protein BCR32DRAFT_239599 [Anaeromyces robustus]|uniref:Uncharacterized protein n=1 Tax=Anaeromyces robustus TaxID=1754192 RepID=A0A1Y1XQN6_9FUNG|nr:hypothetical protein BCR32DRAFT_239599 [Anaeromyces robustus]|eukprot:ORX88081.1 hypothetical protein BCR32DRAFT_239599 [Anaeromyces robustus]